MHELPYDPLVDEEVSSDADSAQKHPVISHNRSSVAQLVGRLAIILPLLAAVPSCNFGGDPQAQKIAQKNSAGALSLWLAQSILDEIIKGTSDEVQKQKIQRKLEALEKSLSQSDSSLTNEIHSVRVSLDTKADLSDARRIVQQVLNEMEGQIGTIDKKINAQALRLERNRDLFGYIPTITPSPLLQSGVEGQSIAHPKVIEWSKLLCRSETHRIAMEDLSRIYQPNADEMKTAVTKWKALQKECATLHVSVELQLVKKLAERVHLLTTLRPTHPTIKQFDAEIASLAWLSVITRPEKDGRYEGTMSPPSDMVGPEGSDIVAAFKLAGEDERSIVPLYRQLIDAMPGAEQETRSLDLGNFRTRQYLEENKKNVVSSKSVEAIQNRYQPYITEVTNTMKNAQGVEKELTTLLQTLSPLHPDVKKLQDKKNAILLNLRNLHQSGDGLLNDAVYVYIQTLEEFRPNHDGMREYNRTIVGPLKETVDHLTCFDWNNPQSREDVWKKFQHLDLVCAVKFGDLISASDSIEDKNKRNDLHWDTIQESEKSLFSDVFPTGEFKGKINRDMAIAFLCNDREDKIVVYDMQKRVIMRRMTYMVGKLDEVDSSGNFSTSSSGWRMVFKNVLPRDQIFGKGGKLEFEYSHSSFHWSFKPFTNK